MSRVLYALRHADAVPSVPGGRDQHRPLSERGRQQAGAVASELAELLAGARLDRVLCSPSTRTRQTLEAITAAGAVGGPVDFVSEVYDAGSDTLVRLLTEIDQEARTVLLVGHAPGVPRLCWELSDASESAPDAIAALERGFPPATLARIELSGDWVDAGIGAGRLTDLVMSR